MMRRVDIDLVVIGFLMSGLNGMQIARALHSQQRTARLPAMLVSSESGAVGRDHLDLFNAVLDDTDPTTRLIERVTAVLASARND
jgi:CheY-like chemotaxis protein